MADHWRDPDRQQILGSRAHHPDSNPAGDCKRDTDGHCDAHSDRNSDGDAYSVAVSLACLYLDCYADPAGDCKRNAYRLSKRNTGAAYGNADRLACLYLDCHADPAGERIAHANGSRQCDSDGNAAAWSHLDSHSHICC